MNMSIRCDITNCKYNNGNEKYCMLDTVDIVRNSGQDTNIQETTDCGSFELRG